MKAEIKAIPKERPILFNSEMVRAVLEDRKTMTRRVVRNAPTTRVKHRLIACENGWNWQVDEQGIQPTLHRDFDSLIQCPFGRVGDSLYVRETFAPMPPLLSPPQFQNGYLYKASWDYMDHKPTWKPSIHMPRSASRITLEITAIRIERLLDISELDALAEGFQSTAVVNEAGDDYTGSYACDHFINTWDKIYGDGSYFDNPWVWVVEFKQVAI